MKRIYKVLVVGVGNMGSAHARAYSKIDQFELVGLVARTPERRKKLSLELGNIKEYDNFDIALKDSKPDVVSINTYTESHKEYAIKSLKSGAHIFIEKPLAENIDDAEEIINEAKKQNKKIVVGYILRYHPTWKKFISISQGLGSPLVMRMNLNQQSSEDQWEVHKKLMNSTSPIVDCGVHYVDVMCQMTKSKPKYVNAIGVNLTDEIKKDMYNYGHLQVVFENGSIGWYEAGWGPMISETAFFVKDVVGPKGSVSIVEPNSKGEIKSDKIDSHTKTSSLLIHNQERDENGKFINDDIVINTETEPDHLELCLLEQKHLLDVIQNDLDVDSDLDDVISSMKIVLAADKSIKSGKQVKVL
ncbi:MAG: oxidoreductase [Flavobacteriales bacterium]|nr:oxidoreductase [Flavobacteriales bacterium]|tara:strand:- start:254 stop:1330 length:1077 start_codon:yes stop_codon:yes gene_type:complete